MNWQHLRAFFWLRWRLRLNQLKKGGMANAIILGFLAVGGMLLSVFLFGLFYLVGIWSLGDVPPYVLMFIWDGMVLGLLFFWGIGMLADLQRSEALSLDKFLHLPVSLSGAFFINYLSSLFSLTLILFLPGMVGLALGITLSRGPELLLLFPLLAAFLFMLTAVTYQFQGWLASLMANKRRRRTIIVVITIAFVLSCQLPNLLNVFQPWKNLVDDDAQKKYLQDQKDINDAFQAKKFSAKEVTEKHDKLTKDYLAQSQTRRQGRLKKLEDVGRIVNLVLPPGWFPYGALALAEGDIGFALLAMVGMTALGAASLWRAYRTSLRYYTGQYSSARPTVPQQPLPAVDAAPAVWVPNWLEKRLPGLSEPAAAVTLGSLRSLTRAPEAKMMLLSPILLVIIFGSMFLTQNMTVDPRFRPLLPMGAMGMTLLSMIGLVGNQFGFDRSGFRIYVLSPAARRDILLGKNLAFAPFALGVGVLGAVLMQFIYPQRFDQFLAGFPQIVTMYLIFCMLANWLSIFAPMALAAGAMKPQNTKLIPVLLHFAFIFAFPLALAPTLLPLAAEYLLQWNGLPVYLVLATIQGLLIVLLYRLVLTWQGNVLWSREHRILEIVTTKAE